MRYRRIQFSELRKITHDMNEKFSRDRGLEKSQTEILERKNSVNHKEKASVTA